ncbi:MAG: hypothetical protein CMD81_10555 [Gammaproteobacteria bacterium]|nr:hypothetical protein [Gammaproteobacteria bacterium]|tara:strand:+ start:13704 stop:16694 length:2991 start_codon:yes stop_codon:yes gene_type:complete
MWRLREESTRQLESLFEQSNGNLELLQALENELVQRPSSQAQSLLAEVQVETFRLQQGITDDNIDWDDVISKKDHQSAQIEQDEERVYSADEVRIRKLLDAWMINETLSPQVFQSADTLASRGTLIDCSEEVPWAVPQDKVDPQKNVFYQVYLGDFDVGQAQDVLLDMYGRQMEDAKSPGFSVLAVATFDRQGYLVGDYGVGVACYGWSYGRARLEKIHHLPYWQNAERLLIRRLRKRLSPVDEYQRPVPVTHDDLQEATNWLIENLNLPIEDVAPIRYAVRIAQNAKLLPPRSPLLNSFLLADLWRARESAKKDGLSQPLKQFLSKVVEKKGKKKQASKAQTKKAYAELQKHMSNLLKPEEIPLSRWPQDERYSLDALQQSAVNISLNKLSPLFSVHGPPGTGKTTLLRDIIAGIIYQRAEKLCAFEHADDAFTQTSMVKFGDQRHDMHHLDESLLGHEILVCSKNNKAVENISLELPMRKEINDASDVDYFSQTMNAYLFQKFHQPEDAQPNKPVQLDLFSPNEEVEEEDKPWGLIAAALGNSKNKKAFVQGAWLDHTHGFRRYFDRIKEAWASAEEGEYHDLADEDLHFIPSSKDDAEEQWQAARGRFLQAQKEVKALLTDRIFDIETLMNNQFQFEEQIELNQARDRVFCAAMELHRAFIFAVSPRLQENLYCFFRVVAGARGSRPDLLPHIWASGALITPVISTTFASVHSMLNDLPNESLGWVLIDEAGQASPQDAIGALLRAKQAIVVGDPQQIEPVVNLPSALVQGISRYYSINALDWMAPDVSVQSLADRVNPYAIEQPHKTGWPILVHRRCAEPMFSMINAMAYEGLMVQQNPNMGRAVWLDVESESDEKWSHLEGEVCFEKVLELLAWKRKDIYIITPFRHVAQSLRQRFRKERRRLQEAGIQNPSHWITQSIGTVHTFQGRQAEYVFFVLGAQGEDEQGARDWATRKVNLCNVAVSRAQIGLFVIGNKKLWANQGVMRFIASRL